MSKEWRRRSAKRKLRAHDDGSDRHAKGVSFLTKQERLQHERSQPFVPAKTNKHRKKKTSYVDEFGHINIGPVTIQNTPGIVYCCLCGRVLSSQRYGLTSYARLPCSGR